MPWDIAKPSQRHCRILSSFTLTSFSLYLVSRSSCMPAKIMPNACPCPCVPLSPDPPAQEEKRQRWWRMWWWQQCPLFFTPGRLQGRWRQLWMENVWAYSYANRMFKQGRTLSGSFGCFLVVYPFSPSLSFLVESFVCCMCMFFMPPKLMDKDIILVTQIIPLFWMQLLLFVTLNFKVIFILERFREGFQSQCENICSLSQP